MKRISACLSLLVVLPVLGAATAAPRLEEIGTLGGYVGSAVGAAINKHGWVVGTCATEGGAEAFVWKERRSMLALGTLGGGYSEAVDVNDALQVVGNSFTADFLFAAFLWTESGGMVALPVDGLDSRAAAISEAGHVAGTVLGHDFVERAFVWTAAGGVRVLGTFGDAPTTAVDVGEQGQVVGTYTTADGLTRGFHWTESAGFVDLGGAGRTVPRMISRNGHVVGEAEDADGLAHPFRWTLAEGLVLLDDGYGAATAVSRDGHAVGYADGRAVLWPAEGGRVDLGTLGEESVAEGISPDGTIVVGWSHASPGLSKAFRWTAATGMVDLGAPANGTSHATRVNNNGRVFGGGTTAWFSSRALVWDAQGMTDVGTFGGQTSEVAGLSAAGHVVGSSPTPDGTLRAFLWTHSGGMRDLGDLGGGVSRPRAVNAAGHVAGEALGADGLERAFFWSPEDGMVDLGAFDGAQITVATMSEQSVVVGNLAYKDLGHSRGFRWSRTGVQILEPLPGGVHVNVFAVDSNGRVLGGAQDASGTTMAVVWEPGQTVPALLVDPATLGGLEAQGTHLTDTGWAAGFVYVAVGDVETHAYRGWVRSPDGTLRLLEDAGPGSFIDVRSRILSINASGDAVGGVKGADSIERPALWRAQDAPTADGEARLTLLAGADAVGWAGSINGAGKAAVILESADGTTELHLWDPASGLSRLGSLGGPILGAFLNDAGQIAGTGAIPSGAPRAFVWPRSSFRN